MQCISAKCCFFLRKKLTILSISVKLFPPVEIILGILFFVTLSSKLKSVEETLAIFIISNFIFSIKPTESSSKGVHEVKSLFFFNYAFKAINGRSNNWGRISPRFSKKYLLSKRKIWPLKYEELLKYYKKIETKLFLSGRKEKHTSFNGKIIKKNCH